MDTESVPCEKCGANATQQLSRPRSLDKLKEKLGDCPNLSSLRFNFNWKDD